jgi:hypothetical protein
LFINSQGIYRKLLVVATSQKEENNLFKGLGLTSAMAAGEPAL